VRIARQVRPSLGVNTIISPLSRAHRRSACISGLFAQKPRHTPVPASPEKTYGQETFGKKLVRDGLKKVQISAKFVYVEFAGIPYDLT
jgi:hypothetical protein